MNKWQKFIKKFKELIASNQFILYLTIFLLSFFIFLIIQSYPTFLDPDSFYHLKMIKLIAEQGPVINFPWLQYTVLKNYYIDHHFLYHVAGIPFVKIMGDFAGYKFYTILLNTLLILGIYIFFKKEKIKYPELFILILLSSQGFMFRISLAKASALSLILLFLGIYFIFKRQNIRLFVLSWLYVWSYGGFLLIWVMTCFYSLADSIFQVFLSQRCKDYKFFKKLDYWLKNIFSPTNLKLGLSSFFGVIAGVIINPYFPKNINFIWEQLVQIGLINYAGKVNVGGEWLAYKFSDFLLNGGVAFILFVFVLAMFIITIKKQKTQSLFFIFATIFFLVFTIKSKRYIEYLMPFMVFFLAYAATFSLSNINMWQKIRELKQMSKIIAFLVNLIILIVIIFFPLIMVKDIRMVYRDFRRGIKFTQYQGISQYLMANSQPGEIVMHTDWDDFPTLFYQNSHNYYIVGLDPTFMYNYDPKLYQLFADITMAKISTGISQKIKENFHASYFVVEAGRNQLNEYLQADPGFVKVYEDEDGWLYQIK